MNREAWVNGYRTLSSSTNFFRYPTGEEAIAFNSLATQTGRCVAATGSGYTLADCDTARLSVVCYRESG